MDAPRHFYRFGNSHKRQVYFSMGWWVLTEPIKNTFNNNTASVAGNQHHPSILSKQDFLFIFGIDKINRICDKNCANFDMIFNQNLWCLN